LGVVRIERSLPIEESARIGDQGHSPDIGLGGVRATPAV
jgi:hypothetical protein